MKTWIGLLAAILLTITVRGETMTLKKSLDDADQLFGKRQYEESEAAYRDLLPLAEKENDITAQVEVLSQIARCRLLARDKDDAREWLAKAEKLASPDQPLGWSRYLGVRGRIEWQDNDLKKATQTFIEMFGYCKEHDLTGRAIDAVHMVAIVGTPAEQIEWGRKGIKLAEESDTKSWLGPLWNNLAITYCDLKDYEEAVAAFLQAREYHWRYGSEINKLYADYHVGYALRLKGEHDEALKWLRPVLNWAERLENDDVIGQAAQDMGEIMIAQGDKAAGLELLRRALGCYEREGYQDFAPDIIKKLKTRIAVLSE
ncbi:MAG: tetratricopeptide repeat protein [candidate division Zixibacteria bacterium]|nr:tetratricopeptide repeat protein [candidate division Zixibacteria bacterium]